jgi:acyl-coenzyme A thioesterase PaaI-like protein
MRVKRVLFSRVGESSSSLTRDTLAAPQPYPPAQHMLRDLRLEIWRRGEEVAVRAPAVPEVHNRAGSVAAGGLGVAVDVIGGNLALRAVQPDWSVTSSLALHLLRPLTRDFEVTGAPLRAGATQVVLDVEVGDGDRSAGPCAIASMTFTRIPRRENMIPYREADTDRFTFADADSGLSAPFLAQLGCRVIDAESGVVELAVADYVRNSMGALQGGAVVALVDAAAESVASVRMVESVVTQDVQLHFLALGRVGPVRTRARWLGGTPHEARLRVELFDTGQRDRLMSVAVVRLARFTS